MFSLSLPPHLNVPADVVGGVDVGNVDVVGVVGDVAGDVDVANDVGIAGGVDVSGDVANDIGVGDGVGDSVGELLHLFSAV